MDPRRLSQFLAIIVAGFVVLIAWDLLSDASERPTVSQVPDAGTPVPPEEPPPPPPREGQSQAGRVAPASTVPAGPESGQPGYLEMLARAEARRQIRESARFTYLNDILAKSTDSTLHRWDNRTMSPVRVHLNAGRVANYQPAFLGAVRTAFQRWEDAGVPVRFDLDADSIDAEVEVRWRVQFEIDRTGQTDLTWDAVGQQESGVVTLATFDQLGQPMGVEEILIVALHEVGHLLGLDHSPDSTDLMYPVARVRDLSTRDIQTALLLYRLSPGSIR